MISEDDIGKLARLANLREDDAEIAQIAKELPAILAYVQKLIAIDVSGEEALSHVHGATNVLRNDEVERSSEPGEILRAAPDVSGRYLRTPIVIE